MPSRLFGFILLYIRTYLLRQAAIRLLFDVTPRLVYPVAPALRGRLVFGEGGLLDAQAREVLHGDLEGGGKVLRFGEVSAVRTMRMAGVWGRRAPG